MEAAEELEHPSGLLDKILPPRLEDSVLRAAAAAKSRATSILTGEGGGGCINDPQPEPAADVLMGGLQPDRDQPGPCSVVKGGPVEVGGDEVVAPSAGGAEDEVYVGRWEVDGGEGRGACVDGLRGLEEGPKGKDDGIGGGGTEEDARDDNDEDVDDAILVEGFVA